MALFAADSYTVSPAYNGFRVTALNDSAAFVGGSQTAMHAQLFSNGIVTDLGTLGGDFSSAHGINNSGVVVGWSKQGGPFPPPTRAFAFNNDAMSDLGTLGGTSSNARDINNAGLIVGGAQIPGNPTYAAYHAYVYSAGKMTDLGTLRSNLGASEAYAINDAGEIVGVSDNGVSVSSHAFIYSNGAMIDIGTFGGESSTAYDINNAGIVVGGAQNAEGRSRAYSYSNGTLKDLGTFGGQSGYALAINSIGIIVGSALNADGGQRAFVYRDGTMRDLNTLVTLPPGTSLTEATAINDVGQIAVCGTSNMGVPFASILTPVALRIVESPQSTVVPLGGSTQFVVSAVGAAPLAFQWYLGESGDISHPLIGANAPHFQTPALTVWTHYWVQVSAEGRYVNSDTVVAEVTGGAMSLTDWTRQGGAPEGQRGPLDTPANDGVSNLMKFALGVSPMAATNGRIPGPTTSEQEGQPLALGVLFTMNPLAIGIRFDLEVSTNLEEWHQVPSTTVVLSVHADGTQRVRMLETTPTTVPQRFARLRVSIVP